jgi:two-component system, OmpR family, KDP operon response regulator KdpE
MPARRLGRLDQPPEAGAASAPSWKAPAFRLRVRGFVTRTVPLLLIVDDDDAAGGVLTSDLTEAGYEAVRASDGLEGLASFHHWHPDLVLTDDVMPHLDGFGLIEAIRRSSQTPVIMISERGGDPDRVRALGFGADDTLAKPFSLDELLRRVRAQLWRLGDAGPAVLEFHGLRIDRERRHVFQGERLEREEHLTPTEFAILELLATHAGKPVTIRQIIGRVWHGAAGTTPDSVRVHVGSLRRKIEPDPSRPRYIITEPWIGYRFVAEPL